MSSSSKHFKAVQHRAAELPQQSLRQLRQTRLAEIGKFISLSFLFEKLNEIELALLEEWREVCYSSS